MTQIRVISLWQPYASLIFTRRLKRHETRGWPCPPKVIGQRVAIHAALKKPSRAFGETDIGQLCAREFGADWRDTLPYGAIVGSVTIAACYPTSRGAETEADYLAGNWDEGRFAWKLTDPIKLAEPCRAVGRQGWWSTEWPPAYPPG